MSIVNKQMAQPQESTVAGVLLHSVKKQPLIQPSVISACLLALAAITLSGCGSTYRPVVSAINPVGPAGQPNKTIVAISSNGPTATGLVTLINFSGDTVLDTTALGVNPYYLQLDAGGGEGYTLNGDGTLNSFALSSGLRASDVLQSTLLAGATPSSIYSQGSNLYISQPGRNSVAQLQGSPPAIHQELPTGAGTSYTVGSLNAPRAYALASNANGGVGTASAIETGTNTISSAIAVGVNPTYGVMTADARRAFILNKGSNTVTVINAQTNALDTFTSGGTVSGTIPVGIAPIWADFAPTLAEMVVANAGNGTTPGSATIISIPLCSSSTVTANPNCDPANPVDAKGFGQVLANVTVGVNPVMVGVLADGTRAYVLNAGNAALGIAGSVSVINLTTNTVTATIPASSGTNAADGFIHGHPSYLAVTSGTPTGKIYVVSPDATDITIIRTDTDTVSTHLSLQGNGVSVRVNAQ